MSTLIPSSPESPAGFSVLNIFNFDPRTFFIERINELLYGEFLAFMADKEGYAGGNSRNGFYQRTLVSTLGMITVTVPRDRKGDFQQQLIPRYARRTKDLEDAIIALFQKGVTTRDIADIVSSLYGHRYSNTTISNITKEFEKQVIAFHSKKLPEEYVAIYLDSTFINVKSKNISNTSTEENTTEIKTEVNKEGKETVKKEALHVLIGIRQSGIKEVIDYKLFPTESASNYEKMLINIHERGVKKVLTFVSDGLPGVREAVKRQFPLAKHQQCWVHLCRAAKRQIHRNASDEAFKDFTQIYRAENKEKAEELYTEFIEKYKSSHKSIVSLLKRAKPSLFAFYDFPKEIQRSLYTTNLIEQSNKLLKHRTNHKEQFANREALDRFVCSQYIIQNQIYGKEIQEGYKEASQKILQMFNELN